MPITIQYPLDPTGLSTNNLVQGELHVMPPRKVRAIATAYGAFFTESLHVFDNATQAELVAGTQYQAVELYELPSARYGKEICAIILITDEAVGNTVRLNYQALGGEFSSSATAIIQMMENLALDDRPLAWGNIISKPSAYPPSHHLHDIGDVYGFEYVVHALDRIRRAIEIGDSASHDAIYQYIDQVVAGGVNPVTLADVLTQINLAMAAHLAAADPHPQYMTVAETTALLSTVGTTQDELYYLANL